MEIIRTGCTRIVILTKNYAFKLPNFLDSWRLFLTGLLANIQEKDFSKGDWHQNKLCPVLFNSWGGWLIVMPRVRILTDEEFARHIDDDWKIIRNKEYFDNCVVDGYLPVELKSNSFGWLDGNIVAIDYGS